MNTYDLIITRSIGGPSEAARRDHLANQAGDPCHGSSSRRYGKFSASAHGHYIIWIGCFFMSVFCSLDFGTNFHVHAKRKNHVGWQVCSRGPQKYTVSQEWTTTWINLTQSSVRIATESRTTKSETLRPLRAKINRCQNLIVFQIVNLEQNMFLRIILQSASWLAVTEANSGDARIWRRNHINKAKNSNLVNKSQNDPNRVVGRRAGC